MLILLSARKTFGAFEAKFLCVTAVCSVLLIKNMHWIGRGKTKLVHAG